MNARATPHSAAGPALGYLYQFGAALLRLLPHALAHRDVAVRLEVVDDVSLDFGTGLPPREVIQVHHSTGDAPLTDTGAKLWRTLAIWAGEWATLDPSDDVDLILLSTQLAAPGSAVAALTQGARDTTDALERLTAVAADEDGAQTTAADRATFLALAPDQRAQLVERAIVLDGATKMVDTRDQLIELLRPTHEERYTTEMADALEGWWWPRVARALTERTAIHADDVRARIDEARRTLSDRALPILGLEEFAPDELPTGDPQQARYIACLHAIDASAVRRDMAVQDFRRAFAHRSRWTRRGLLGPGELQRYEDDLFSEWRVRCDRMLRHIDGEQNPPARSAAGHELWDQMETQVNRPLRPETTDAFVLRGSLHQLAEDQRLAWHPDAASEHFYAAGQGPA